MRCGYRASKSANALTAIATAWSKDDVLGALAHVDYIDDNDRRNAFKGAVLRQWAWTIPRHCSRTCSTCRPTSKTKRCAAARCTHR